MRRLLMWERRLGIRSRLWTFSSILLALEHRRRTGVGQSIDIAMYDCLVMHNDHGLIEHDLTGEALSEA